MPLNSSLTCFNIRFFLYPLPVERSNRCPMGSTCRPTPYVPLITVRSPSLSEFLNHACKCAVTGCQNFFSPPFHTGNVHPPVAFCDLLWTSITVDTVEQTSSPFWLVMRRWLRVLLVKSNHRVTSICLCCSRKIKKLFFFLMLFAKKKKFLN